MVRCRLLAVAIQPVISFHLRTNLLQIAQVAFVLSCDPVAQFLLI
jgi:hypothetical protein